MYKKAKNRRLIFAGNSTIMKGEKRLITLHFEGRKLRRKVRRKQGGTEEKEGIELGRGTIDFLESKQRE